MVLGLNSYESEETVRNFGDQFGVTFPLLLDGDEYLLYRQPDRQSPFPLDYIIDRNGEVAYFDTEYNPVEMQSIVDSLINPETEINEEPHAPRPDELRIISNYPNPFNSTTNIVFYSSGGFVRITAYDLLGRMVANVFEGYAEPGKIIVRWDLSERRFKDLKSGIYFYRIKSGERAVAGKMLYLK